MSLDAENGYLLRRPSRTASRCGTRAPTPRSRAGEPALVPAFPIWSTNPELKWPLQDVDAPAGVDTGGGIAGQVGVGLVVVDLRDKSSPKVRYQSY